MSRKRKDAKAHPGREEAARGPAKPDLASLTTRLKELVARANTGDRESLEALRLFLDDHPEIQETVGDLTRTAEASWLDLLVSDDTLGRESVRRQLEKLKSDLAGTHAAGLEKLLVDEIGVCFLANRHAEIMAAGPAGGSLAQAAFRLRRADSAQRRFLSSIKTLATLRALAPEGMVPLNPLRIYPEERKRA
jgi:hypothetical protein